MQNIEEALGVLTFPEPEPEPEAVIVEETPVAEIPVEDVAVVLDEAALAKKQAETKKDAKRHGVEETEDEFAKDGVSLDELFKMKPEIFQNTAATEEDSDDKKKGKKGKKKGVELVLDEDLGEVVGRKKHKRGDDPVGEDW
jgi:hypothetical protein